MKISLPILLIGLLAIVACQRSPEKLPKYKKAFKAQIASFEKQKVKTNEIIEEGVVELTGLEKAIAEASDVDKEFNKVYGDWKKIDRQVESLYSDYEKLKKDADNLFTAMSDQTNSINDKKTKDQLSKAINKTRTDYSKNLSKTEIAVSKLRKLHSEAVDVVKALEVAVGLGQIAEFGNGLQNIESRVETIMGELNSSIAESKALYDERIGSI